MARHESVAVFRASASAFSKWPVEKYLTPDWREGQRPTVGQTLARAVELPPVLRELLRRPAFDSLREQMTSFACVAEPRPLEPEQAARLYGPALRTSISRLEEFAACSFKFFVHSGLRAEERQRFELDVRERGSFQHEVLARFHQDLQQENKKWRDINRRSRIKYPKITSGFAEISRRTPGRQRAGPLRRQDGDRIVAGFCGGDGRVDDALPI